MRGSVARLEATKGQQRQDLEEELAIARLTLANLERVSDVKRQRHVDATVAGFTPDERVLESMAWLSTVMEEVVDGPAPWRDHVEAELGRLVRLAVRLCGLAPERVDGALCPYCGYASVQLVPYDAELSMCITAGCVDEAGRPAQWRGWKQWQALEAAT
jgi:hypothetical protein